MFDFYSDWRQECSTFTRGLSLTCCTRSSPSSSSIGSRAIHSPRTGRYPRQATTSARGGSSWTRDGRTPQAGSFARSSCFYFTFLPSAVRRPPCPRCTSQTSQPSLSYSLRSCRRWIPCAFLVSTDSWCSLIKFPPLGYL